MTLAGALLNDRYRLDEPIGKGGMGVVYRGHDTLLDRPVAVKLVSASALGTEGRSRVLREARAAARLNHENIVAVFDAGEASLGDEEGRTSYIVMELVEGPTLQTYQCGSLSEMVSIARQICEALQVAHKHDIVHRDLKPQNVLVSRLPRDSADDKVGVQIKLMDFGLAQITGATALTQKGTLMGTFAYLAPELIFGQPASHQSDLYAMGVMLYQFTAGRPPFEADTVPSLLSQHVQAPVVPPSSFNGKISPVLDMLILKLLSKRPEDRPASAAEVQRELDLWQQAPAGMGEVVELDRIARGRLVGRESEFEQAQVIWRQATGGRGQLLLISGEPGIGKTRLVSELATLAEIGGGRVVKGACYAEGGAPYVAIAQCLRHAFGNGRLPELPDDVISDLLSLAPDLRMQLPQVEPGGRRDEEVARLRLLDSFVTFCRYLMSAGPLLLFIDDVHWADSGTLAMLRHLARRSDGLPIMLVITYREVELDQGLPFRELLMELNREQNVSRIKLSRLDRDQTSRLLGTLLSEQITPEIVDGIYRETEGNPFFVEEVCRTLVDSGHLSFQNGRWRQTAAGALEVPQGVKVAIQSRLARLAAEETELLQLAALLGREFSYTMLAAVSDLDEERLIDALEQAERAQLVEEIRPPAARARLQSRPSYSFTHGLIHTTLLAGMSTLRRHRKQRTVAVALEEAFPARRAELAPLLGRYFAEAGDGEKAVGYLLQAGDDAGRVYAYEEAAEAYEHALLFLREMDAQRLAASTLMKLGLVYHSNFNFERARLTYDEGFALWQRLPAPGGDRDFLPAAHRPLRSSWFEPFVLDPNMAAETASQATLGHLFSGLVELLLNGEIVPDVARSWQVLDGGHRYIFQLREDARWSDGRPVQAGDFYVAWRRILEPERKAPLANLFYDIRGARAFHMGKMDDFDKVGIRVLNEQTLQVELEAPSSYFLFLLSQVPAMPVPSHVVEQHGDRWTEAGYLVTNGPFRLLSWDKGKRIVLRRHENYHGYAGGNLEEVHLLVDWLNVEQVWQRYKSDQLDLTYLYTPALRRRAQQRYPDEYLTGPLPTTAYIGFDASRPPFDNRLIRRAFALAVDREMLANVALQGALFPAAGGLTPPGIPGHIPLNSSSFDPNLARQLLADSGHAGGKGIPHLTLPHTYGLVEGTGNLQELADVWRDVLGVTVEMKALPIDEVVAFLAREHPRLWMMGWTADYPDPDSFLRASVWREQTKWSHEAYDSLVEEARSITDQVRRLDLYRQAELILAEEAPITPVLYGRLHMLIKPWVRELPVVPLLGLRLKHLILDPPDNSP